MGDIKFYSPVDFDDTSSGVTIEGDLIANANVGIGTTSPHFYNNYRHVTIDGTSGAGFMLRNGGSNKYEQYVDSGGAIFYLVDNDPLKFFTNSTERLRVTGAGNVGIGTTSPSQALEVNGIIKISNTYKQYLLQSHNTYGNLLLQQSGAATIPLTVNSSNLGIGVGNISLQSALNVNGGIAAGSYYNTAAPANGMIISGDVGIGTTSPSEKLDVNGNVKADSYGTFGDVAARVFAPAGAGYNGSSSETGYLIIKLPDNAASGVNNMMTGVIKVFDYSSNETFYVNFAGYWYSGYNWTNTSAWITSSAVSDRNFTIRFGKMNGASGIQDRPFITIGESASTWSYPKFQVIEYTSGHSNAELEKWNSGWDADISTTLPGTSLRSVSNAQVTNWARSGQNLYYGSGTGNVGIGTTSPSQKLHVDGNTLISAERYYYVAGGGAGVGSDASGNLILRQNSANLMTTSGSDATFAGNLNLGDNNQLQLGTDADLVFYSDNTQTLMHNYNNDLIIKQDATDGDIRFQSDDGSGGTAEYFRLDGGLVNTVISKDFRFEDNVKGTFGASQDLKIYHDGSNSYITDTGTGDLYIRGSNSVYIGNNAGTKTYISGTDGGATKLYYNGAGAQQKLETTSTGVEVDGNIIGSGGATFTGQITTDYGLFLTNGATDFLLYNNTNENVLYMRDMTNGQMLTNWTPTTFRVYQNLLVNGTSTLTGNVGIGTTSPSQKLEVVGNVKLDGDNRHIYFGGNNTFIGENSNSNKLELRGGGNSMGHTVYIDNTGQLGIGTSAPSQKLHVSGSARITGAIYDSNNDPGTSGQVLSSTVTGTDWVDQGDVVAGSADKALSVTLTVKNTEAVALTKGQVVCAAPSATPPSGNVIEVKLADNNGTDSMPALGVLNEGLDAAGGANDEGEAIMFGRVSGIDTSAFDVGDEVFVSDTAGGLTKTKPTGVKYIQKIGVVIRDDASNGTIEVFGAGRTNDVPTPLYVDHANQRLGIGTTSPSTKLDVDGVATSKGFQTNTVNTNYNLISRNSSGNSPLYVQSANNQTNQPIAQFNYGSATANAGTQVLKVGKDTSYFVNTNVGIGTTSPDSILHVESSSPKIQLTNTSTNASSYIDADSGFGSISIMADHGNTSASSQINLMVDGSSKMVVKDTGKVGIGTTNPANKLTVRTSTINDGLYLETSQPVTYGKIYNSNSESFPVGNLNLSYGTTNSASIQALSNRMSLKGGYTTGGQISFLSASTEIMRMTSTGLGIGTTSPSQKLDVAGNISLRHTTEDAIKFGGAGDLYGTSSANSVKLQKPGRSQYFLFGTQTGYFQVSDGTNNILLRAESTPEVNIYNTGALNYTQHSATNNNNGNVLTWSNSTSGNGERGRVSIVGDLRLDDYSSGSAVNVVNIENNGDAYFLGNIGIGPNNAEIRTNGDDLELKTDTGNNYVNILTNAGNNLVAKIGIGTWMKYGLYAGMSSIPSAVTQNTHRVIIQGSGTTSSTTALLVENSSGSDLFKIRDDGNVGIGTTSPTSPLHVVNTVGGWSAYINNDVGTGTQSGLLLDAGSSSSDFAMYVRNAAGSSDLFSIKGNGNVGIGTTNPTSDLFVNSSANVGFILQNASRPTLALTDGTNYSYIGLESGGDIITGTSDNDLSIRSPRDIVFGGNSVARMTIQNAGNVGIGTTSPSEKLHITDSQGHTQKIQFGLDSIYNYIGVTAYDTLELSVDENNANGNSAIAFRLDGSERIRINTSGNVGIGTTSPGEKLDVYGNVRINTGSELRFNNANVGAYRDSNDLRLAGYNSIQFLSSTTSMSSQTERMRITNAGNVGIGTTSPQQKLDVVGYTRTTTLEANGLTGSINLGYGANFKGGLFNDQYLTGDPANSVNDFVTYTPTKYHITVGTPTNKVITVDSSNNVGITGNIHVVGATRLDSGGGQQPGVIINQNPTDAIAAVGITSTSVFLSEPDEWLTINIGGTDYVIPAYLP